MRRETVKAVVTGGAGFIGSHLVDGLIARGDEVHIIDNLRSGRLENVHPQAVIHIEDVTGAKAGALILQIKPDVVFHLAAQADVTTSVLDPGLDETINISGTIRVLEACRLARVKKIIFASTSAVYGDIRKSPVSETDRTAPISYYGLSKQTAESYIRLYRRFYQLPYTILRYGNVYGPRQVAKGEGGVVAVFLNKLRKNEPLKIFGDGEQTRDFVYVRDIVRANIAAIDKGDGETIHVSTAQSTSLNQLIEILRRLHGSPIKTEYGNAKPGDIRHSCLNNRKAGQLLGFAPSFSVPEGLRETYTAETAHGASRRGRQP